VRAPRCDSPCRGQRGQALPIAALLLVLCAGALLLVVEVGRVLDERARAATAADAAALAGAAEGEDAARALAAANGAVLESFRLDGADAVVVVRVGRARATARATREPPSARSFERLAAIPYTRPVHPLASAA
jgi:uncharacterized membrane protein